MNNDKPAFPVHHTHPSDLEGMSIGDFFAAYAMQAMLHPDFLRVLPGESRDKARIVAIGAFDMAEEMLDERERRGNK